MAFAKDSPGRFGQQSSTNSVRRLLIVDDSPSDREGIRRALRSNQLVRYEFSEAECAEEGLHRLLHDQEFVPDLVILDLHMPSGGGRAVMQELINAWGHLSIPIIVLTGDSGTLSAEEALEMGAQEFLHKAEISPSTLHRTIENAIQRHRLTLELQQSERRAALANESKSAFLANMSHEIRTPMTAVLGLTQLLAQQETDPEKLELLRMIQSSGENLVELLNDILDLSKIEAGKLEAELVTTYPHRLLREVHNLMQHRSAERGVSLQLECATPIPRSIRSDPARLRQILVNLIGNAVKFTERGSITISLRFDPPTDRDIETAFEQTEFAIAPDRVLVVAVTDTGPGMTPEQVSKLFQPFMQGDASTTRRFGGSGLGLAISQRLARMLGGRIDVQSVFTRGSTFSLRLPVSLKDCDGEYHQPDVLTVSDDSRTDFPIQTEQVALSGRVLVAEDTPASQFLLRRMLGDLGLTVTLVETGRDALDRVIGTNDFDLILMDMHMPVMDGFTATQELRAAGITIPIVALTANAMRGDRERCLDAGCSDYIAKPIDRAILANTLQHLLSDRPAPSAIKGGLYTGLQKN